LKLCPALKTPGFFWTGKYKSHRTKPSVFFSLGHKNNIHHKGEEGAIRNRKEKVEKRKYKSCSFCAFRAVVVKTFWTPPTLRRYG